MTSRTRYAFGSLIGAVCCAAPVQAETLPVEGIYGARVNVPADIETIAVERFSGDRGFALQDALTEAMQAPVFEDQPFYYLVPAALASGERVIVIREGATTDGEASEVAISDTGSERPDALLAGHAGTNFTDYQTSPKVERECIARDDDGKCTERRRIEIDCREVTVSYEAQVTLIAQDGSTIYRGSDRLSQNQRYCADEYATPDPDAMIAGLESQFFARVQRDLMPRFTRQAPRLMERRRGLSRPDRRVFKDALAASNGDINAACAAFRSLEQANPRHVSVLFNIGLCLESEDNLDLALDYYARALEIEPGKDYPMAGQRRIRSRLSGEAQLAARGF